MTSEEVSSIEPGDEIKLSHFNPYSTNSSYNLIETIHVVDEVRNTPDGIFFLVRRIGSNLTYWIDNEQLISRGEFTQGALLAKARKKAVEQFDSDLGELLKES